MICPYRGKCPALCTLITTCLVSAVLHFPFLLVLRSSLALYLFWRLLVPLFFKPTPISSYLLCYKTSATIAIGSLLVRSSTIWTGHMNLGFVCGKKTVQCCAMIVMGETSYTYHYVSELQCSNMMNHVVCFQFVWPEREYRHITPYRVCQNIFDNDTQTTRQSQDLVYICAGIHGIQLSDIVASRVVVSRAQLVSEKDCHDILNPPMDNATTENIATSDLDIVHMVISPIGVLVNSLGLLVICGKEFRLQQTYARVTEFLVSNMIYLTIPWTYCVINIRKIGITNMVSYVCKVGLLAFKITTSITYIAFLVLVVERYVGTCRPRLYSVFTTGKLMAVSII